MHYFSPAINLQGVRGSAVGGIEKIESGKYYKRDITTLEDTQFFRCLEPREMISILSDSVLDFILICQTVLPKNTLMSVFQCMKNFQKVIPDI